MAEIYDWDIVAANNNSAPPDGAPENMNYQEVNDTMREMMAVVARFVTSIRGATATAGSSNAYTLVSGLTIGAYEAGQIFSFIADRTSTGSVTLNVDGLGASNLVDSTGVQCGSGDIKSGSVYAVVRRSSDFQLLGTFTRSGILALSQITFNKAYTTGGSSNAYTVTTGFSLAALTTGMVFAITPDRNNTGAATLNVDGIGAVAWEDAESAALVADDVQNGVTCVVIYNGTEFRTIAGVPTSISMGGTGGITASEALKNLITAASQVAAAAGDLIPIADVSDSNNGKKVAASTIGAGKQTIWIPAAAMVPSMATPPESVTHTYTSNLPVTLATLDFDSAAEEHAHFAIAMPKGWNEGTLTYEVLWSHGSTTTNFGVTFGLFLNAFSNDATLNENASGNQSVSDTGGTTDDFYVTPESAAITMDGTIAAGDLIHGRLTRQVASGSDTLAVDARVIGIRLFYTTNANTDD